jgi:pentose-5-phosphate-3-epimerase
MLLEQLVDFRRTARLSFTLELDGGVSDDTISMIAATGADRIVVGRLLFGLQPSLSYLERRLGI